MDTLILPLKKRVQTTVTPVDTSILPVETTEEEKDIKPVDTSILPSEEDTPMDNSVEKPIHVAIPAAKTGRRKIEIKKIEDRNHRHVMFSKRRASMFQKASELCILTGAEVAIITQSPGNKRFYSFVQPDLDSVIDHFMDEELHDDDSSEMQQKMQRTKDQMELSREYIELCRKLKLEKDELKKAQMNVGRREWWNDNMDGASMAELEEYLLILEKAKKSVLSRCEDLKMIQNSNHSSNNNNPRHIARYAMDELSAMFVKQNQQENTTGIDSHYGNLTGPFMF